MDWNRVEPLEYFASLVSTQAPVPVFEAAVTLAQVASPDMDVQPVLLQMDLLIRRLLDRLSADASSIHRLRLLHHVFFDELSFGGNANDFYSAPNGLVSEVLRTRRGIPATLALIYVEMARSIGLVASAVAFPGHFLVRVRQPSGFVFIDPLTGRSLGRDVLEEWLAPYLEASVLTPGAAASPSRGPAGEMLWQRLLAPVTDRDVLLHLLRHLEAAYRVADDAVSRARVIQRLVLLQPQGAAASGLPGVEDRRRPILHDMGRQGLGLVGGLPRSADANASGASTRVRGRSESPNSRGGLGGADAAEAGPQE